MSDWGVPNSQVTNSPRLSGQATGKAIPSGATAKIDPKLASGARQFEALILEQMLKPLHFGSSPDMAGEENATGSNDTLSGFGTQAVAQALSAGKGFGLARQIIRQVAAEHDARSNSEHSGTILSGGIKFP